MPRNRKLIFLEVKRNGPLSQKEIVERTRIAERTVRGHLKKLIEMHFIEERINLSDLRSKLYFANGGDAKNY